jgi:hypothetical protein
MVDSGITKPIGQEFYSVNNQLAVETAAEKTHIHLRSLLASFAGTCLARGARLESSTRPARPARPSCRYRGSFPCLYRKNQCLLFCIQLIFKPADLTSKLKERLLDLAHRFVTVTVTGPGLDWKSSTDHRVATWGRCLAMVCE